MKVKREWVNMSVRLSRTDRERIDRISAAEQQTYNQVIRQSIADYAQRWENARERSTNDGKG